MKAQETETISALHIRMDDLVTGQLGPLAAWRLRRRIARDPALAREFTEIQQMQADLRSLARQNSSRPAQSPATTWTIGGLTMKRRAVLAASLLTIFAITGGAVASRYWSKPAADASCTMRGWDIDSWYFHGQFRGNATVVSPKGNYVNKLPLNGSSSSASIRVIYSMNKREVAQADLSGMGKHSIRDRSGNLLGSIILSPLTDEDVKMIKKAEDEVAHNFLDFYQRIERVTPSDDKRGFYPVMAVPGLVGGYFREYVRVHGETRSVTQGASWKVYGQAGVKAQHLTKSRVIVVTEREGIQLRIPLEAKSIVESGATQSIPSPASIERMPPDQKSFFEGIEFRGQSTPQIYWSLADPDGDGKTPFLSTGEWRHVLRTGQFTGYGRHEVKDESGKTVLVLTVSPLTPTKTAR